MGLGICILAHVCVCACVRMHAQSCLTLYNPMDCSQPGFSLMGFSRQEHWSGLPFPPPGELPHPGIKPASPVFVGGLFTTETIPPTPTAFYTVFYNFKLSGFETSHIIPYFLLRVTVIIMQNFLC